MHDDDQLPGAIKSIELDEIIGSSDWYKGDTFSFDGLEYRIGEFQGDYVEIYALNKGA